MVGLLTTEEQHLEYTAGLRRQGSLICARTAGSAGKQPSGCQQPGECVCVCGGGVHTHPQAEQSKALPFPCGSETLEPLTRPCLSNHTFANSFLRSLWGRVYFNSGYFSKGLIFHRVQFKSENLNLWKRKWQRQPALRFSSTRGTFVPFAVQGSGKGRG